MQQISDIRLEEDPIQVMDLVRHGEILEITKEGIPFARIVPLSEVLDDLVAAGVVIPPINTAPFQMPIIEAEPGVDAGEVVSSMRDEERW